jgi:hypothetical protein
MPTTLSALRTQLTASIRLERMLAELTAFEAELGVARESMFVNLVDVDDLDDAMRYLMYARQELEGCRRSLLRVWADREPAKAPTAMSELASSMRAAGIPFKEENA